MSERLCRILHCDLPIQLAPMGSVSASARLPAAVAAAGGHAMYPGLALPPSALAPVLDELASGTSAFGVNFIVPFMDPDSLSAAISVPFLVFVSATLPIVLLGSCTLKTVDTGTGLSNFAAPKLCSLP